MLETCRGSPGPISLSVEKIKFDQPGPVGQNGPNF